MKDIKLYTRNLCAWCVDAKEYLKGHGIPFQEIDVGRDPAANDEMVLGALEALAARGVPPGQVVTVGYDVIPDAARAIEEGRLTASIEQFPGQQARKALGLLVAQIRDGKPPPAKEIYLTPLAIDKHNLDKAEVKD